MANGYTGSVSATQVGPYFVGQYYQILQQQPHCGYNFYTDSSTVVRVDGDTTETATAMMQIHTLIMSLNYTGIEIKTINSLDSWNRGILVVVSGLVKSKHFSGKRSFVESFYLAPQEKGYFVLNDIFQFVNEEVIHHYPLPTTSESQKDQQLSTSTSVPALEPTAPDYLEAPAVEYVGSVHNDREVPIEHYNFQEHQQDLQEDFEPEPALEETYAEDSTAYLSDESDEIPPEPLVPVSEPVAEPAKLSYASILRVAKEPSTTTVVTRPSFSKIPAPESEWEQTPRLAAPQLNLPEPTLEAPEEVLPQEEEGEFKSVYVRNLPPTIVASDIEKEFRTFGTIKPDGVFIRIRNQDVGVCYAFVEFEDLHAVHNAIKASPIMMAGRPVYIEERRANSNGAARGGGRGGRGGRGRGGYQSETASRGGRYGGRSYSRGGGNHQDGNDFYRSRSNSNGNGYGFRG